MRLNPPTLPFCPLPSQPSHRRRKLFEVYLCLPPQHHRLASLKQSFSLPLSLLSTQRSCQPSPFIAQSPPPTIQAERTERNLEQSLSQPTVPSSTTHRLPVTPYATQIDLRPSSPPAFNPSPLSSRGAKPKSKGGLWSEMWQCFLCVVGWRVDCLQHGNMVLYGRLSGIQILFHD